MVFRDSSSTNTGRKRPHSTGNRRYSCSHQPTGVLMYSWKNSKPQASWLLRRKAGPPQFWNHTLRVQSTQMWSIYGFCLRDRDHGLGYMLHIWVPGPVGISTTRMQSRSSMAVTMVGGRVTTACFGPTLPSFSNAVPQRTKVGPSKQGPKHQKTMRTLSFAYNSLDV